MTSGAEYPREKIEEFLDILEKSGGILLTACTQLGINRSCHYRWMKEFDWYKERYKDICEGQKDYVESKLMKQIKNDSERSIIFYLKTRAKDRGYFEKTQNDLTSNDEPITATGFRTRKKKE